ncbi:MAG: hypothetical protein AB2L07_09240 [Thermoanaerobaculaceae bacterium]
MKSHIRESGLAGLTHDRPGDAFQVLPGNVAYLKLSAVKQADAAAYVRKAAATKGWIIDIRNYPADFMVFVLGQSPGRQADPLRALHDGGPRQPRRVPLGARRSR